MNFRNRLKRGEPLVGTLLTLDSLDVAEILSQAGYDWLFLDLEHSALGPVEAQRLLQGIAGRVPTLVRIESRDEVGFRKALDIGAAGIIVPQVNSAAEALRAVSLAKYPPLGTRSVGLGRATNFGNNFSEYLSKANEETVVVVQIEHIDALRQLEAIASTAGVDALFVGPYDLSGSLGRPGEINSPDVLAAIDETISVARRYRLPVGIFASNAAAARDYLAQGFSLVAMASDGLLLGRAAAAELKTVRG